MDGRMVEDRQRKQTSTAVGQYANRLKESRSYQFPLLDKGYVVKYRPAKLQGLNNKQHIIHTLFFTIH